MYIMYRVYRTNIVPDAYYSVRIQKKKYMYLQILFIPIFGYDIFTTYIVGISILKTFQNYITTTS